MKFFKVTTLLSSFLFVSLAYPCDVQDTPEPFHLLCYPYSTHHNQLPKSVAPNTSSPTQGIPAVATLRFVLSISSQECLHSMMVDIQYAYECGHYSRPLLKYEHSHYHKSVLASHDIDVANLLGEHYNGTWLPTRYDNINYLWNGSFFDIQSSRKFKTFIETKVTAMKLQGFNL